jgi:hypothetical protein
MSDPSELSWLTPGHKVLLTFVTSQKVAATRCADWRLAS